MPAFAVYDNRFAIPIEVYKSHSRAKAFVGNAISIYNIAVFEHLTPSQAKVLPYAWASDFNSKLKECYRNAN